MNVLLGLIIYAIAAYFAYLIIKTAVRHGIEESQLFKEIREMKQQQLDNNKGSTP